MNRQDDAATRAGDTRREAVLRMLPLVLLLAGYWLVLSGHFDPLMLALGAVALTVVCAMTWRAELYLHRDLTLPFIVRLPRFLLWLAWKVFVSSLTVVRKVWSPRRDLRPVMGSTPAHDLSELSQVAYANAITLTPGTLSLDIGDRIIRVHSLEQSDIDELRTGSMLRRVPHTGVQR